MPTFRTLDDLDPAGKRVIVRGDLNVPAKDGKVTDTTRIDRQAPTILEITQKGGRVALISHFGRPDGKRDPKYSLKPVLEPLQSALGKAVQWVDDCVGPDAERAVAALPPGGVALLENLRFHPGEEKNDPAFARALARLGDVYVNDAFSAAHRAHASTEGITRHLPAYAGRLMQAELEALENALENPQRPVVAIVGGAKISTKLELLGNLVRKVQMLVIGGAMANTFLYALGTDVGKSLVERDMADTVRDILGKADEAQCEIVLPRDAVVARALKPGVPTEVVKVTAVPSDMMILDIGPQSAASLAAMLADAKTVVWNGPLGAFETPPFDAATSRVAQAVAKLTKEGKVMSVAGGGDTVAALIHAGVEKDFSYVSTAGGAFLEWLEGKELPGVAALKRAAARA
jgi:phosphoglycerate kinase